MRIRAITAAIAALAMTVGAAPAAQADGGAKTRIEISKLTSSLIKGTIRSEKPSCKRGRHVQVFRYDGFLSIMVGRMDAQNDGDWRLRQTLLPGRYFAKVDSKPGCRYDVSPEKRLG